MAFVEDADSVESGRTIADGDAQQRQSGTCGDLDAAATRTARVIGATIAHGQVLQSQEDRGSRTVDVERPIERGAVDHRLRLAVTANEYILGDVQITAGGKIIASTREREHMDTGSQRDDISTSQRIGLLDCRAQAARGPGDSAIAHPVARQGIGEIRGRINVKYRS
ncbi:hypothetical protein [Dokdonella sp.]|uniref:hypothetical protein n=1 Tax=Dokdonella sp. TaxID=2291710 RepID=UPI0025BAB181|nr:hypothetical protein [Dokdonella sp.]MBX3693425.1 hypothetical protein [Dokdonella sp.]